MRLRMVESVIQTTRNQRKRLSAALKLAAKLELCVEPAGEGWRGSAGGGNGIAGDWFIQFPKKQSFTRDSNGIHQADDIAIGKEAAKCAIARILITFAGQGGNMIAADRSGKTCLMAIHQRALQ